MTKSHEERIRMIQYAAVVALIGYSSIFFTEHVSQHLEYFGRFQGMCVLFACLAYLGMRYTGKNATTLYDRSAGTADDDSAVKKHTRATDHSIWRLTWQILSNKNFFWFVTSNFMSFFHSTFSSNFCMILVDMLVPKDTVPQTVWSIFYGTIFFLPRVFFLVMRPLMSSIGYYRIMRLMMCVKVVAGSLMYFLGRNQIGFFMLFLMLDSVMAHAIGSMFGLVSSDIIEDDARKYKRSHPLSSMVMGTNALVVKPAQSLAPILAVFVLNLHGYDQYKAGSLPSSDGLKSAMFTMSCLLPVAIGIGQFLCWSWYDIRDSHLKEKQEMEEVKKNKM